MGTSITFFLDLLDQNGSVRRKRVSFRRSFWLVEAQTYEEAWRKVSEMKPAVGTDGRFAAVLNLVPVQIVDGNTVHLFSNIMPWPKNLKLRKVVDCLSQKTVLKQTISWESLIHSLLPEKEQPSKQHYIIGTIAAQLTFSKKRNVIYSFWRVCAPCADEAYHRGGDVIKQWFQKKTTADIYYNFIGIGYMDLSKSKRGIPDFSCILPCFDKFEKPLRDCKIFLRNLERRYGKERFMRRWNTIPGIAPSAGHKGTKW